MPTEEQLYPICGDNIDMGEMGAGYPLFFEFLKYNAYLLLLLCVVYFIPTAAILANEYKQILDKNGGKLQKDENMIALSHLEPSLTSRFSQELLKMVLRNSKARKVPFTTCSCAQAWRFW